MFSQRFPSSLIIFSMSLFTMAFATACSVSSERNHTLTPGLTDTAIPRETVTPEPPISIEIIEEGITQVELDSSFRNLPTGTYMIYYQYIVLEIPDMEIARYMSFDGRRHGQILTESAYELIYGDSSQTNSFLGSAKYLISFRYAGTQPVLFLTYNETSEQTYIKRINLENGEMHTWKIVAEAGAECYVAAYDVSANGHFISTTCEKNEIEYYIIINLAENTKKLIYLNESNCPAHSHWWSHWSRENRLLAAECEFGAGCLINPEVGEYHCRDNFSENISGWSYDGRLVLREPYALIDPKCLQNAKFCEKEPIPICSNPGPDNIACSFAWDHSGKQLVWSSIDFLHRQYFYSDVTVMDTSDGSYNVLMYGASGYWDVADFSLDDQWIVFNTNGDEVILYSIDSGFIRRTPNKGYFLGWLVIP